MCFSNVDEYKNKLQEIREIFRPDTGIFVLEGDGDEIFLTFNTTYDFRMGGYIKVNKKKENRIIFTIDALNHLSMEANGSIVKDWSPNWDDYRNSILLVRNDEFVQIKTKLKEVIKW